MPTRSPYPADLRSIARRLEKTAPQRSHSLVYEAFVIAALAGDRKHARALLDVLYRVLPPAKAVVNALSTHAIDVYCHAAGFGDITRGAPTYERALVNGGTLDERVRHIENGVRLRVTENAYAGEYPESDAWQAKREDDPWRKTDRWRRVQWLARPEHATRDTERDALRRLDEILSDWPDSARGAGYGSELVLAIDLALRHGEKGRVPAWIERHGRRIHDEGFLADTAMCFPSIAKEMVRGTFRDVVRIPAKDLDAMFASIEAAARAKATAPAPPVKVPSIQKRRVTCEYSQVHLEPTELTAAESEQVHFQDPRESEQGMSLFETMVAIATPSDTEDVRASVRVELDKRATEKDLAGAVQAVCFPLVVRGPLYLRSVADAPTCEPLVLPEGRYDVLATFKGEKVIRGSPLRRFDLDLSFRREGALSAPKCLRLEDGSKPPAKIFRHR